MSGGGRGAQISDIEITSPSLNRRHHTSRHIKSTELRVHDNNLPTCTYHLQHSVGQ